MNSEFRDALDEVSKNIDDMFPKEKKIEKKENGVFKWFMIGFSSLIFLYLLYHFVYFYIMVGNIF